MPNRDVIKKWVAALESGDYEQTTGVLRRNHPNGEADYCCLGVLCDLAVKEGVVTVVEEDDDGRVDYERHYDSDLPMSVQGWAGLDSSNPVIGFSKRAVELNDDDKLTFPEIAQLIRQKWLTNEGETEA